MKMMLRCQKAAVGLGFQAETSLRIMGLCVTARRETILLLFMKDLS